MGIFSGRQFPREIILWAVRWYCRYDEKDPTLSSGEHALAVITAVLVEHWDRLDGAQQRVLVDVLEDSTRASEAATVHLRELFNRN